MMGTLTKLIKYGYTPADPGNPGNPGQTSQPSRTHKNKVEVCQWVTGYESMNFDLHQALEDNKKGGLRIPVPRSKAKWVCNFVETLTTSPATPYIRAIAPRPATPEQFLKDFQLGWNARADSIPLLIGNGRFTFKVPASTAGVMVGLAVNPANSGFADIQHGFYVASGITKAYELGVEVASFGYHALDELEISRIGGKVQYLIAGEVVRETPAHDSGPVVLSAAMYSGGDVVLDADIDMSPDGGVSVAARPGYIVIGTEDYAGIDLTMGPMSVSLEVQANGGINVTARPAQIILSGTEGYAGISLSIPAPSVDMDGTGVVPPYAIIRMEAMPGTSSMWGHSGTVGGIGLTIEPFAIKMAEAAYADILMASEPMEAFLEGGEPSDGVTMFTVLATQADQTASSTLYVVINSAMQVTGLMQVQTTATGNIPVGLSASASMDVQITVKAFIESLFKPSAGAFDQAGEPLTVWALNMDINGSTRYEGYDFNSFAEINGLYYGAKYDGLYLLEGPDDVGTAVDASVNFGNLNFGTIARKALPYLYCGVASNGGLILKVVADGATYLYTVRDNTELLKAHRFELGKGLRASYYDITLMNQGGTAFDLAEVEFFPLELSRKL